MFYVLKICLRQWVRDERAATAIEYAMIAGGVSLVIVAAIFLTGGSLQDIFDVIAGRMADAEGQVE